MHLDKLPTHFSKKHFSSQSWAAFPSNGCLFQRKLLIVWKQWQCIKFFKLTPGGKHFLTGSDSRKVSTILLSILSYGLLPSFVFTSQTPSPQPWNSLLLPQTWTVVRKSFRLCCWMDWLKTIRQRKITSKSTLSSFLSSYRKFHTYSLIRSFYLLLAYFSLISSTSSARTSLI